MKKAIIVSCFDGWFNMRLKYIKAYLVEKGYNVQIWMSDFDHTKKTKVEKIDGCNYIEVIDYSKNLSLKRLYSHYDFSKKVHKLLNREFPDLVYALLPPNSVARECALYKNTNHASKLIFDIIDLWPESYTESRLLQAPFNIWQNLRDNSLIYADKIFTECKLYQSLLPNKVVHNMMTLHLCREKSQFCTSPYWTGNLIEIGYLGSINNIIDIHLIEQLISDISSHIKVHINIIGGGEKMNNFIEALKRSGATISNHGMIFDTDRIRAIFDKCHFAINMMKPSVMVGLTIKSLDYFQMGLPILNTIKGDTSDIVNLHKCGYNINNVSICSEKIQMLTNEEYQQMRINTQGAFQRYFTLERFMKNLDQGLKGLIYPYEC